MADIFLELATSCNLARARALIWVLVRPHSDGTAAEDQTGTGERVTQRERDIEDEWTESSQS